MENSLKTARYVIEDSIPKATSDGEPHELMTIVAMISGLIAAVIVLIVLFSLIVNRRQPNSHESNSDDLEKTKKPSTIILPIFGDRKIMAPEVENSPRLVSIVTISEKISDLDGKINVAFNNCPSETATVIDPLDVSNLTAGIATVHC